MRLTIEQRRYMMGIVMFLMFMPMGMWMPSLPNILQSYAARWILPYVVALTPLMAIASTLAFASLSDRRIEAQKLLGLLALSGAFFLWLAFSCLKGGWHPGWYLCFQACYAWISAPMIALITKIKLANLPNPEKSFPLYSMCGTLGWISAGVMISAMGLDASADAGRIAACVHVLMGAACFVLPATLPEDQASRGWRAVLGLSAFGLLKHREMRVVYIASSLIAIPYVSFFMMVPTMLKIFGSAHPTVQMSIGQGTEVFAMLLLSAFAGRYRMRWMLMLSMVLGLIRFAILAWSGTNGLLPIIWLGIALHGPIYTCMTVTGRIFVDRRVDPGIRGQAQALYSLLVMSVAGIIGSFVCELIYQNTVTEDLYSWAKFWWILTAITILPLVYCCCGLLRTRHTHHGKKFH